MSSAGVVESLSFEFRAATLFSLLGILRVSENNSQLSEPSKLETTTNTDFHVGDQARKVSRPPTFEHHTRRQ